MSLQNFQYDIIMREYNRRQTQVMHDLENDAPAPLQRLPGWQRSTVRSLLSAPRRHVLCSAVKAALWKI